MKSTISPAVAQFAANEWERLRQVNAELVGALDEAELEAIRLGQAFPAGTLIRMQRALAKVRP